MDLAQVIGTGEGGRITKKDVLAYVAAPVPRESAGHFGRPRRIRRGASAVGAARHRLAVQADRGDRNRRHRGAPPAPAPQPSSPDRDVEIPLTAIRRAIARHMLLSKQTSPHVTTVMEADMARIVRARERLRGEYERQGVKLTFTPFFIQAIVAGLKAVPTANSSFTEDTLVVQGAFTWAWQPRSRTG